MDIIGTALAAAQTLNDAMQCCELVEKLSVFGYESELDDLQRTVETITAVLRDAETKLELSHQARVFIEQLKDVVFEADDLMDEFATLAQQQRVMDTGGSLREKVSHFFSRSNPICVSYWMSRGVKDIKKKLDAIAYNNQFSFKIDPEPIRNRRPDSCSYVNEVDIIGREDDLERIVGTLLASNDQPNVSFLSIVGIGGLGKTALAQLVYNDQRVTEEFSLRKWICVSDQDQKELDVREILCKILGQNQGGSTVERVQSQLRDRLAGNKYLIIFDDVWTEKREQWFELAKFFVGDQRGSWILVTTRSQKTAKITDGLTYELPGLSKENSWHLFQKTAFTSDQLSIPPDELVRIGQEIVEGCARVPLAIRVAGSLLYGQEKSKWQSVQQIGLVNIRDDENGIMPILKLSFHHLESPLKSCFSYCAMFPKDFPMPKEKLINLWIAQGYVVPLDKLQNIEDAAEEYFSILLRRCFFQDITKDDFGVILSCKIHDLMHDVAQSVSGNEICTLNTNTIPSKVGKKVRHLSVAKRKEYGKYSLGENHIRSHLFVNNSIYSSFPIEALVASCRRLRALDLSRSYIRRLPDSISELLHLRYLDLSENDDMQVLPNSITKLCNLQTLRLNNCSELVKLPKHLSRLIKLRVLCIVGCTKLTSMPRDMGKLTCLRNLEGYFEVGGEGTCVSWKQWFYGIEDLKTPNNLKRKLFIKIRWPKNVNEVLKEAGRRERLYLRSKEKLDYILLCFEHEEGGGRMDDDGTARLMEELQPHSNLKWLELQGYHGLNVPSWVSHDHLPLLVKLTLVDCNELEYLPCLENLRHLKSLKLGYLTKLEFIEDSTTCLTISSSLVPHSAGSTSSTTEVLSIFPFLENLVLQGLPRFKGWKRKLCVKESSNCISNNSCSEPQLQQFQQCFPNLYDLTIDHCSELMCNLRCPRLEILQLKKFNDKITINTEELGELSPPSPSAPAPGYHISNECTGGDKFRRVSMDKVAWLNMLPLRFVQSVQRLVIENDHDMVDLPDCIQHFSAIQSLLIYSSSLNAMPSWMSKLNFLKELRVYNCPTSLKKRCEKDPPGEDWPYIQHIPISSFRDN